MSIPFLIICLLYFSKMVIALKKKFFPFTLTYKEIFLSLFFLKIFLQIVNYINILNLFLSTIDKQHNYHLHSLISTYHLFYSYSVLLPDLLEDNFRKLKTATQEVYLCKFNFCLASQCYQNEKFYQLF